MQFLDDLIMHSNIYQNQNKKSIDPRKYIPAEVICAHEKHGIGTVSRSEKMAVAVKKAEKPVLLALREKGNLVIETFHPHVFPGDPVDHARFLGLEREVVNPHIRGVVGHVRALGCRGIGGDELGENHAEIENHENRDRSDAKRAGGEIFGELFHSLPYLMRGSIIIPPKILNIINRRASDEGSLSIGVGDKNIYFRFANYEFASVLIEGQFPNYSRVIPASQDFSFEVDTKELLEALKRVALLVEQKSRRIYMTVAPGTLTISSQETEIGTAKEEIPCRYDGAETTIALNYLYLEEPIKVIGSERVKVEFTEPMKAVTLNAVPAKDFFHIVMPMQME